MYDYIIIPWSLGVLGLFGLGAIDGLRESLKVIFRRRNRKGKPTITKLPPKFWRKLGVM